MKVKFANIYEKIIEKLDTYGQELMRRQVTDEARADFGGLFKDKMGYTSACHTDTTKLATVLGCCYFSTGSKYYGNERGRFW